MDGGRRSEVTDPLYVVARSALLDALEAIGEQRDAIIVIGAQAIYLHTGDAALAVPPFTIDGDLAIDPARLKPEPKLEQAMLNAQFRQGNQPGSWLCDRIVKGVVRTIPVDLMVPEAVAGGGRRAARLGEHGSRVGRRARGLEGALVDHQLVQLGSLEPDRDQRSVTVRLAGPSALLVAKLHKVADRSQEPEAKRVKDKDALDVLRLLRIPIARLAEGLRRLLADSLADDVTREAIVNLERLFGSASSAGTQMVIRATERLEDPVEMARSCELLAIELLDALRS
jgi:hypothetical protein